MAALYREFMTGGGGDAAPAVATGGGVLRAAESAAIDARVPLSKNAPLVATESLDPTHRGVFPFRFFNAVQSAVLSDAYRSDVNLVVSAPTGSGKTAVLELAVLRMHAGATGRHVKAIYIAPLKALCQEKFNDWSAKFRGLGLRAVELTGDSSEAQLAQVTASDLVLTTPEKWDATTRRWRDAPALMESVGLILIDEVHLLNEERGACLEAMISRCKTIQSIHQAQRSQHPVASLRFVALSATIPNSEDIAQWLGARAYHFGNEHRPVPLQLIVRGFQRRENPFKFESYLNYKLADLIRAHAGAGSTIVFSSSRSGCTAAADAVIAALPHEALVSSHAQQRRLTEAALSCSDKALQRLLPQGVAIHTAALVPEDRRVVERLLLDRDVSVLCATTTLSQGVNLPARLVIIKGTKMYAQGKGYREYPPSLVLQMIGRAGRPQFDSEATAVVLTEFETQRVYENILDQPTVVESRLLGNLKEHLNAEIALRTIGDVGQALEWIKSTFLFVRFLRNPGLYDAAIVGQRLSESELLQRLRRQCVTDVNDLATARLVEFADADNFQFRSTTLGSLAAKYYLRVETARAIGERCAASRALTLEQLLDAVSSAAEFDSFKIRMGEKQTLKGLNRGKPLPLSEPSAVAPPLRFPVRGCRIATSAQKASVLMQSALGGGVLDAATGSWNLRSDQEEICRVGARVAACIEDLATAQLQSASTVINAILLRRSLECKCWPDSPTTLAQVPQIGAKSVARFVAAGIVHIRQLETLSDEALEQLARRHAPFGSRAKAALKRIARVAIRGDWDASGRTLTIKVAQTDPAFAPPASADELQGHRITVLVEGRDDRVLLMRRATFRAATDVFSWSAPVPPEPSSLVRVHVLYGESRGASACCLAN
jgi:ATP-dependent DNA helicase HFM1/MER3